MVLSILLISINSYATTYKRAKLDVLVAHNKKIVVAKVLKEQSQWNEKRDFLETRVNLEIARVIKGDSDEREMTMTLMGGSNEEVTHLIVGGAELHVGNMYLLFIDEMKLPGNRQPQVSIPEHAQGVYDIVNRQGRQYAISQANGHHMVADDSGQTEPVGGSSGMPLEQLIRLIENAMRTGEAQ